ncbi:MAG: hypothetical protein EXR62_02725 [Chloroflexi bacterium]|nr:hypothetical protein [Chloroflexota bacterium]
MSSPTPSPVAFSWVVRRFPFIILAVVLFLLGLAIIDQWRVIQQPPDDPGPPRLVLILTQPVAGQTTDFANLAQIDRRKFRYTLESPARQPADPLTFYSQFDAFVVDNYLPPVPHLQAILAQVAAGKGLWFKASQDYAFMTQGDPARLAALLPALPITFDIPAGGASPLVIPAERSSSLIPIGVNVRYQEEPFVKEVGWLSVPAIPVITRTTLKSGLTYHALVEEFATPAHAPILARGAYGAGLVLALTAPVERDVNNALRDWPYFKYLLYLSLALLSHSAYLPYGSWPGAPETLTPEMRLATLVVLAFIYVVTCIWLVFMAWRTRRTPLVVKRLELRPSPPDAFLSLDGPAAFPPSPAAPETAGLDIWERAGMHKALSGHLFTLVVNLVTATFVILTNLFFLPTFLIADPAAIGITTITNALFALLFVVADFGSLSALGRFLGEYNIKDPTRAVKYIQVFIYFQLVTGLLQTTAIWLYAIYILPGNQQFAFLATSFLFKGLVQWPGMLWVFRDTLGGLQKYDDVTWIFTSRYIIEGVTYLAGIWIFQQLLSSTLTPPIATALGAQVGSYLSDILVMGISIYFLSRIHKGWSVWDCFRLDFDLPQFIETMTFGGKVLLSTLSALVASFAITLLQINTVYNYLYISAFISIAIQTKAQITEEGRTILDNLYAPIAEAYNNGKLVLTGYYISQGMRWYVISTVPLYLFSLVILPLLLRGIIPPAYQDVIWMTTVLAAVSIFLGIDILLANLILGANVPHIYAWGTIGEQMARLVIYFVGLPLLGPVGQVWLLLLGNTPPRLVKIAVLWRWANRHLLPLRIYLAQTLVLPLAAGLLYLLLILAPLPWLLPGLLPNRFLFAIFNTALSVLLIIVHLRGPRGSASRIELSSPTDWLLNLRLNLVLIAGLWLLLLVATFLKELSFGLIIAGQPYYYIALILSYILLLPAVLFFPLLGWLGGWDDHGLSQFGRATLQAGLGYALYYPSYVLTLQAARFSPWHNRFAIPYAAAERESAELDQLRVERTFIPPAPE